MTVSISQNEYEEMVFGLGSPGVCTTCETVDEYAGCEPDASEYVCPSCEKNTLYGLEEALMMGLISIE